MEATHDVVVVGAGLAGLAAGAAAARAGARTLILDGHPAGGRARTDDRRGFRFNQGAHALYQGGVGARVLDQLGVGMPPGGNPSTDSWGLSGDLLSPLPVSAGRALRSKLVDMVGTAQLARFIATLRRMDPAAYADRSAEAWLTGLGYRPGATAVLRTLTHVATFADDLTTISADAAVSQLQSAARHNVRYLHGGWQVLVDGLASAALSAGAELRIGAPAVAVEGGGSNGVGVRLGDGTTVDAGAVVIATGGPAAVASLLPEPPRWGLVGPPSTVACLDLGLRKAPPKAVVFGVGEPLYFSTHTPNGDLAPKGHAVVHLMRYGARDAATDRAELWALARAAGVEEDDVMEQRFLARMVVTQAVPVPGSGLAGRPSIDGAGRPGVTIAGDWVGPEGLLADAALSSGQAAGRQAASTASRRQLVA